MEIWLVVASRLSKEEFLKTSLIWSSVRKGATRSFSLKLIAGNSRGLPEVYNSLILESFTQDTVLIFAHDDILITDLFWLERVIEGLECYDVIGVAGNVRRIDFQPSWAFLNRSLKWDDFANLSGTVAHGATFPAKNVSRYGPSRKTVKLLDGVFLATKSSTLKRSGLLFDACFQFHFYDVDFCRRAEALGLQCGTWDISIVHASGGHFKSEAWSAAYELYLKKWGS
jgi:GT2 family glycosyltransferase